MAFGGGNVLRQAMDPTYVYEKNSFYEKVGRVVKGAIRGPGAIDSADPSNEILVNYGSQVYNAQCVQCHGIDLQGHPNWKTSNSKGVLAPPPLDASGQAWQRSDQELFIYTLRGGQAKMPDGLKSGMPGFGDLLNTRDIWAVLSYVKSSWPEKIRKIQSEKN